MILYHGTNQDIESIDLTKGLRYKDFGKGFYLTPDKTTAIRMAQKIGPIADDGVVLQLTNYREGIYTPEQAAQLLQDKYLDQQYYFGTEQALRYLHKTNVEVL